MLERRHHQRARGFVLCVVFPRGPESAAGEGAREPGVECVVRNLSEGGALLLTDAPRGAPARLLLVVSGDAKPARVVWRGEGGVGVAFTPDVFTAPTNVVSLEDARRRRAGDGARLAERIARFVGRPEVGGPA